MSRTMDFLGTSGIVRFLMARGWEEDSSGLGSVEFSKDDSPVIISLLTDDLDGESDGWAIVDRETLCDIESGFGLADLEVAI